MSTATRLAAAPIPCQALIADGTASGLAFHAARFSA
jgi:hypothetical protein